MTDALLFAVLLVGMVTLTIAVFTLRSSRRSEALGEDRYELLRDQHDRLGFLDEERRMFIEELERESDERRRFVEDMRPQVAKDLEQEHRLLEEELEQERQVRAENARRAEQQEGDEQSRIEQQAERVAQDLQQLTGDLEREREERLEAQRLAEQLGQERQRLEQEHRLLEEELERELSRSMGGSRNQRPAASPWWRKPIPVVVVLLGSLIVWLTSLVVALNFLNP